jgi:hypothetical protein
MPPPPAGAAPAPGPQSELNPDFDGPPVSPASAPGVGMQQ